MTSEGIQPADSMSPVVLRHGHWIVIPLLACLVVAGYLWYAINQNGDFGFPLDDAWIHQVYARNLATRGEFAFFAGQPSAGSTSPLWALLLTPGYALFGSAIGWAVVLGVLALGGSAILARQLARRLGAAPLISDWAVPLCLLLEWHLAWAAVSGMEILLFILLSLALISVFWSRRSPLSIGLLGGLLTLTRPEGIILAGIVALGVGWRAWREQGGVVLARVGLAFGTGLLLLLIPYLAFNYWASGTILPNTFYAKTQEYGEVISRSNLWLRWLSLYRQPFLGGQLLLLPGLIYAVWTLVQRREWEQCVPLVWVFVLPLLYAVRLPVDYQYGRYEMPVIPFLVLFGMIGTAELLRRIRPRFLARVWALSLATLVVVFAGLGAGQYAESAGIINCEMVAAARWTAEHLPREAPVAAHDIGALGYFDSRPILDLAGLVSPEVIPFIRDQSRLKEWMRNRGAKYAIFFPDWYPKLDMDPDYVSVYSGNCLATRVNGGTSLRVYKLK